MDKSVRYSPIVLILATNELFSRISSSPHFVTRLNTSMLISEGRRLSVASKKSLRKGTDFRSQRDLGLGINGELWRQCIRNAGAYVYGAQDSEQTREMTLMCTRRRRDGTSAPLHTVTSPQHGAGTWPRERSL